MANVALPIELRSPYLAIPTISYSLAGPTAATPMRSPISKLSLSATPSSTATSPSPDGQRPSTRLRGLKRSYWGSVSIPKANAGAPPVSIVVAVRLQQLGLEVLHRARSHRDAVDLTHPLERVLGDRRRLGAFAFEADVSLLARDDGVGAGVRLDENRVERLVDRVGEDVGAAHHRDAQDDRDRGEDGPELPPGHARGARP